MTIIIADIVASLQSPVAVLYGGNSAERAVSLNSGKAVIKALQAMQIPHLAVDTQNEWINALQDKGIKHALILLHGGDGEDGTVQGVLDTLGISYAGSGVEASAVAMDKVRSKQIWAAENIPTPPGLVVNASDSLQDVFTRLGHAVIVKPAHEGSSVGMAIARTDAELETAVANALKYDVTVLIESLLDGPEYTVAVLGDTCLPSILLKPDGVFYDYDAKYISNDTKYVCPAGLSVEHENELAELSQAAFEAIGCKGWGRVDIMSHKNTFYVLEVNTIPGMTDHSLVPKAAAVAGMSFEQLVLRLLADSLDEA